MYIDYFIVSAAFGGGTVSQQASAVSAAENDAASPNAVADLAATQGSTAGEVKLTWTASGDDGGSGSINGGKYRIGYTTDPGYAWSVETYQVQLNTNTSAGSSEGYVVGGLTSGATYYFRMWTADEKPNWSDISNGATAYATPGSVSVTMDGIKDAGWGTSPLATSAGFKLPNDRAKDLYAMSDDNYLYVGFQFNGDPWDDAEGAKKAHFVFYLIPAQLPA